MLSDAELLQIDDWRFKNRVATRSEAIRRLVQIGTLLDANNQDLKETFLNNLKLCGAAFDKISKSDGSMQQNEDAVALLAETILSLVEMGALIKRLTHVTSDFQSDRNFEDTLNEVAETQDEFEKRRSRLKPLTSEEKSFLDEVSLDAHEWRGLVELGKALFEFEPLAKRVNLGETVLKRLIALGLAEEGPSSSAFQGRGLMVGYRQTRLGMLVEERGRYPKK